MHRFGRKETILADFLKRFHSKRRQPRSTVKMWRMKIQTIHNRHRLETILLAEQPLWLSSEIFGERPQL
jgi:hypothetical protein